MRLSLRLLLVAVAAVALGPWVGSATSARQAETPPDGATATGAEARPADGGAGDEDARTAARPPTPPRPVPEGPTPTPTPAGTQAGGGELRTYTVEVEPATGWTPESVAAVVDAALLDPERGWTASGRWALRRVDDPADADIRVVLATPGTVDAACAGAGLETNGIFSCWDGARAMLNVVRWEHGAEDFDDLATYRRYQVNHEVGHALGFGHVECPQPGALAPVMMQQTKSTAGCVANGWPYP